MANNNGKIYSTDDNQLWGALEKSAKKYGLTKEGEKKSVKKTSKKKK